MCENSQALTSKIETKLQSESEYETDTDEDDDDDEEERMKPIFIPKAKRETIKEQELKLQESKLREDKKIILDENRKRQVGHLPHSWKPLLLLLHFNRSLYIISSSINIIKLLIFSIACFNY